jgi:transposase
MAKAVQSIIVGIDAAKLELETFRSDTEENVSIRNEPEAVDAFLASLPNGTAIAIESTGRMHELLVARALERGFEVYLVNGFQLKHYRDAVGQRAKTDASDARLLARFLDRERDGLRPVTPRSPEEKRLWQLLRRRACAVHHRTALKQSLRETEGLGDPGGALLKAFDRFIAALDRLIVKLARSLGWADALARLQSIPGVGRLTGLGLLLAFRHAPFRNADAYVAFMGLDVRVRDSGAFKGRRRLTKRGDPELRRLLFLAGRSARLSHEHFGAYFQRLVDRGVSRIGADIAVGRKLARVAFALLRDGRAYEEPTMA